MPGDRINRVNGAIESRGGRWLPELELSAGTIDYEDTGGGGPAVVLLHGLLMDSSQWRHVVASLRAGYRCMAPTLPIGGHRRPMRPDADLSLPGPGRLVAGFLGRPHLDEGPLGGIGTRGGFAHMLARDPAGGG